MSMTAKSVLVACAAGVVGVGSAAAQVSEWTGAVDVNWLTAGNWSAGVPTGTARVLTGFPDLSGSTSIGSLDVGSGGTVEISLGSTMTITGPMSTNNGLIKLNEDNSSVNSTMNFPNATMLGGTGVLELLTSADNSQLTGAGMLVNGPSHTIRGTGRIGVGFVNQGVIDGSIGNSGQLTLEVRAGGENQGTMSASTVGPTNGVLQIVSVPIVQTGAGRLFANGGQIQLNSAAVTGGTLETASGGLIATTIGTTDFTDVTNQGDLSVNAATNVAVFGTGFLNNGVTTLNTQNSSVNSTIVFEENGTLGGTGEIRMRTANDNSQINSAVGVTINHADSHAIRGVGRINAAMNNAGTIAADASVANPGQNTLELELNDKTNSGLIEARSGSTLQIEGIAIDQTGGGDIQANDGIVSFFLAGAAVLGGDITSSGTGSVGTRSGSTTAFADVDLDANLFVDANSTLNIDGSSLTNNGTITVNNQNSSVNGIITTDDTITIDGSGTIVFRTGSSNSFMTTSGAGSFTLGSGQFVTGSGDLDGAFINNGVISADLSASFGAGPMDLGVGPYTNNNLMTAELNSELQFEDVLVTQSPAAVIESNDGLVTFSAGSRVEGGTFVSGGTGIFRTLGAGDRELSGVVLNGLLQIEANTTVSVDSAGLVNNGLIEINRNNSSADGNLDLSDATISGTGEIQLRTGGSNSFIRTDAGTTGTIGAGQLVTGAGFITGAITNEGVIAADGSIAISNFEIQLNTNDKINNNQLRAEAGSLLSVVGVSIDQSAGGSMLADEGRIEFRTASVIGGTLGTANGGVWATDTGVNTFEGVLLSGSGAVDANTTLNVIGDTLSNDADIIINPQNSAADGVVQINEDATFTGTGTMDFFTTGIGNSRVSGAAGLDPIPTLTNAAGHTMSGVATVQVPMVNEGTIVAGRPFNDFTVQQPLTLTASSNFNVAIGLNAQNGQLDPNGADGIVNLGGTLNVSVVEGQVLANGRNHVIVDGPYTGDFDVLNLAVEGQLITRVRYETDQVVLRTRCRADTNLDGAVTPADFNAWIAAFNNDDTVADQNLDGLVSPSDFNAWILNFNTPCP